MPTPAADAPVLPPPPVRGGVLTRHTLGASPGQPRLIEAGAIPPARRLARLTTVLPELDVDITKRKLTRQPAFIVSMLLALTGVGGGVGYVVHHALTAQPVKVEATTLVRFDDNYLLEWSGPDDSYAVILVDDDGTNAIDISVFVRGREAWIPRDLDGLSDRSCFLVRSHDLDEVAVSVDAGDLVDQGAQLVCVGAASDA